MINNLDKKELNIVAGGDDEPPVEVSGGGSCGSQGCNAAARVQANIQVNKQTTLKPYVDTYNGRPTGGGIRAEMKF